MGGDRMGRFLWKRGSPLVPNASEGDGSAKGPVTLVLEVLDWAPFGLRRVEDLAEVETTAGLF